MSKFLTIFVLLSSLFLSNFFARTAFAANSCSMSVSSNSIGPGESVTVTVSGGIWNDNPINPADGDFYLESNNGVRSSNLQFANGTATITLPYEFFNANGTLVTLNMFHWNGVWGDSVCGPTPNIFLTDSTVDISCSEIDINPKVLNSETGLATLLANGCDPNSLYRVLVSYDNGSVFANYDANATLNGNLQISIGPFSDPGQYEVTFLKVGDTSDTFTDFITVQDAGDATFVCGSAVPQGTLECAIGDTTNCCPQGCYPSFQIPSGSQTSIYMCACGLPGQPCCNTGNIQCYSLQAETVYCNSTDYATPTCDYTGDDFLNYSCGEVIDPEDLGTVRCAPGCPIADNHPVQTGAQWCSCGSLGGKTCPPSSGLTACATGLIAKAGTCQRPDNDDVISIFCDDLSSIHTAFGCFNFDSPIKFVVGSVALLLGISGGVALILIGFASFKIMTSAGNPQAINSAKELLASAIAGILMVALSTFLLRVMGVDILGLFS